MRDAWEGLVGPRPAQGADRREHSLSWWVVALGWTLGWLLLWRLPRLEHPSSLPSSPRTISVVVPARNEADRLPVLLASLARQDLRPEQVIVVDDSSADGTGEVASQFPGVEVIQAPPVPDGWAGKPWACTTGARSATGDLLVFLDADVELHPAALSSLVATWSRRGGLVSVQQRHDTKKPFEGLSLPFNVVSMMALGVAALIRPRREWGAAGPCLITTREAYNRVGGHGAVSGEVAEDLALAERYRLARLPVTCRGGHDMVRFRMYRDAPSLVEGWSKNLLTGARRSPLPLAAAVGLWVTAMLTLAVEVVRLPRSGEEALPWMVVYAAGALQIAVLGRKVGRFGAAALAWPLLMAFFVAVFLLSAVRTVLLRQVRWSGRQIPVTATGAALSAQIARRASTRSRRPRL